MKVSLFYKNVTLLDYAYIDDHVGIIGNSLRVDVELVGTTKDEVIFDFSYAKKTIKSIIDDEVDHRLVVPSNLIINEDENIYIKFNYGVSNLKVEYWAPRQAVCSLPTNNCTSESITAYIEKIVMEKMPDNVDTVKITLVKETDRKGIFFNYTHGLKDHYGNCQRLLHGHRSKVNVFLNNERKKELEKFLAYDLFNGNIHFVMWENIVNKDEIIKIVQNEKTGNIINGKYDEIEVVEINYKSNQGVFRVKLPGRSVYIMPNETTVENLAVNFSKIVTDILESKARVTVYAYEGIGKGAISTI